MSRGSTLRFRRRLILIAVIAIALILGMAAAAVINVSSYRHYNAATRHSSGVLQQILSTSNALRGAESGLRGHLLTGDTGQLESYLIALPKIDQGSAQLLDMTRGDPPQHQLALNLRASLQARARQLQAVLARYRGGDRNGALSMLRAQMAADADHPLLRQTEAMRDVEMAHQRNVDQQRDRSASLTAWFTFASLSCALALLLSSIVLVLRQQRHALDSKEALMQAYMQLAQSLEESRGLADRMQRLHALSETLQNCRSMHEALRTLPPSLEDMLPDTAGVVMLINASRNLVETASAWGQLTHRSEDVFAPDDCYALRRGQAYPESDTQARMPCAHLHPVEAAGHGQTWLCVPLLAQGETLGVLHMQQATGLSPEIRDMCITLGEQLGLLLGNLRLQESLHNQSIRDPLTGLYNRRYLETSLYRELLRNIRQGSRLTVLMMDLDHFKRFNDVHGHDAGDQLLQQFAALLRELVRAEDIACRYGGEEFTVILPDTDAEAALRRAETIRARTEQLNIRHRGALLGGISVSIGLAVQEDQEHDTASLLHAADQALYRAKRAGRNRIESATAQDHTAAPEDTN